MATVLNPRATTIALPHGRSSQPLWVGLSLLALGIAMPVILPIESSPVLSHFIEGLRQSDTGRVLLAAAWLVCINTIRALPVFLGGFLAAEGSVGLLDRSALPYNLAYVVPVVTIPCAYFAINHLHGLDYHFGTPALLAIVGIFAMHRLSWHTQGAFNKIVIFALFLFGLQWLHVVPALSNYGFGAGSISRDIKVAAVVLDIDISLTQIALVSSAFTTMLAFIMSKFMVDHSQHLTVVQTQQRQERELLERRVEMMASRTAREVENLVHDLKTPLAGVQSLMRTMAGRIDDDQLRTPLLQTEDVIENMLHMISETLHPESRRHVPARHLFDNIRVQFADSDRHWQLYVPDSLPIVHINAVRITRAIANLIQNALESNVGQQRPVTVGVGVRGERLRIRIRDYGAGIPPEALPHLSQVGFSTKTSTGLGIPFATGIIVGGHEGDVRFLSKPDKGTLAIVQLPIASQHQLASAAAQPTVTFPEPEATEAPESTEATETHVTAKSRTSARFLYSPDATRSRRILAIDDDPAILLALHFLAEEAGWELIPCDSPAAGIDLWRQESFDIALLDYRMPNMDGLNVLRHMRRSNSKTPIVMLTVDDNAALARRLMYEGASDFVLKPIKPLDLMERLRLHLRDPRVLAAPPTALDQLKDEKGVQPQTLDAIIDCIRRATHPLAAREIASACNIATPTAYRYLTLLEEHSWIRATLQHGVVGRPRKLYRWHES